MSKSRQINTKKWWFSALITVLFCQLGIANQTVDSILVRIQNASPEDKLAIWHEWGGRTSKENIALLWGNTEQAYLDAKEVLDQDAATSWYFKFLGNLTINLQSAGYGDISTEVLDKMKSMGDSIAAVKGAPHSAQGNYYYYLAYFHYKQVDMEEAESLFLQSIKISEEVGDAELEFSCYEMLGLLKTFIDEHEQALVYYNKAIEIADDAAISNQHKIGLYKSIAFLYHAIDQYEEADNLYRIVMDSIHLLTRRSSRWRLRMDYAVNLGYLDKVAEGIAQLDQLRPEIEAEDNNDMMVVLSESYTEILLLAGKYQESAEWLERSREYYYRVQESRRKDEVQEWQAKYQSTEKEATIRELEQQRTISRSRSIIGVLIGLTLIGLLSFFLYANHSRRKRLRLQLDNEREVNNIRNKFFSSIAHDIRTPLALMLAPLERLENKATDTANKKDIQLARRNGIRLMDLFNQILDWNKADAKLLKLNSQIGRFDLVFNRLCERFEQLAIEKGIRFTTQINVPETPFLLDYGKLDRVVSNLLDNAIKYCDAGDGVFVSARVKEQTNTIVITIRDDGPGIAEKEQAQIFNRYFQGEQGRIKGGSGIGLALVQELVEIMGGQIQIDSRVNDGTKFTVQLPLDPADAEVLPTVDTSSSAALSPTEATILIIEDEPELSDFLVSDLSERFNVLTANTVAKGLSMALAHIPDIIISDWMLPDDNGGQLSRQVNAHELTSHIPIIILTAYNTEEHHKEALDAGAVVWMSKPFQMSTLNKQIDTILKLEQRNRKKWNAVLARTGDQTEPVAKKIDPLIEKVQKVIQGNYTNEKFSINRMAEALAMSRVQLFRKVKSTTGSTPGKMLNEFRLQKAQKLLQASPLSVSEICFQVGFSDPGYFAKLYKKRFGISPSQEVNTN